MKKRILSMLLAFALILCAIPMTVMADEPEYVYISISDDSQYISDANDAPIAYAKVSLDDLANIDLSEYGLEEFSYDADGDGKYETTALHLYIYVHTEILGNEWESVTVTGAPGSIYFQNGLFGFTDENLRYDLNGAYPAIDGWGLTADQIVLNDGDFVNVAHYSSWTFWGDSATGFHYFTDGQGNMQENLKHFYTVSEGENLDFGLVRSYSDWNNGGLPAFDPEAGYPVYYGTAYGNAEGSVDTDENGCFSLTFPTAGTWYLWANGGYGAENPMDIVSSPAYAKVIVESAGPSADEIAATAVVEKIDAIGTVTLDSEDAIAEAREAYDALTDAQKELVENYEDLEAAEETLAMLKANEAAATVVEEKIDAIGTVTLDSEVAIAEAREAYDALTNEQKELVENYDDLEAAEETLAMLKANEAAATEVEEKIDAIGTVTLDSEDAIAEAREAYDALTDDQKELVDNYSTLTVAETELAALKDDEAAATTVEGYIDAIGSVTLDSETEIAAARGAYDALTDAQKKLVENYEDLEAAEEILAMLKANEAAATEVEEKIDAIGTVTLDSEDAIAEAREAYDALTDAQKELVENYEDLEAAEETLAILKANEAAASAVEEKIDAIGTVTLDSEDAIAEARKAYDALTDAQKELVENYDDLEAAEETLAMLKANEAAATEVEEKIDAIGNITIFSGSKVEDASDAYGALTEAQKALVENKDVLDAAKERLAVLYEDAADADHRAIYNATGNYIQGLGTPGVGSTGGEWMVIDLTRAGNACPEGYYDNVVKFVNENINEKEQLHRAKSTENSRIILGLTSAGYDVTDVDGHNLLFGLTDMTYLKKQGINGPIWALIAFDCYDYEIPTNPDAKEQATREGIIDYILSKQHDDGGWSLQANVTLPSDPDMTGMAIQALAPYYNTNSKVKAAVDEALVMLSETQSDIGGFGSIDGACTESCAQVIVALTSLGIDPETDSRFIKNGISVMDALCVFAVEGGGFEHVPNGGRNGMATEQGQYALASYFRFKNDQTSLYDMTDVTMRNETVNEDEGVIKNTTDEDENAFEGSLDVADKSLGNAILTEEEKELVEQGVDVNVSLSVKDVSENVSEEDKTLIDEALEDETLSNAVVGMYLDITLTKQVGDATPVVITETNDEVKISIAVPEDLINTDSNVERTYKILRIHDGKVDVLDAEFDVKTGKLTFKTDAFSTYTLIYSDTVVDTENKDEVVNDIGDKEVIANTNDATNIETPIMSMSFGLFGMIAVAYLAKKKEF